MPDLRKLTDEEIRRLVVELAPSWLVDDHPSERRWVIAEAQHRGIDPESLLRDALGFQSHSEGIDFGRRWA